MKKNLLSVCVGTIIVLLVMYPQTVMKSANDSLDTCINILMPTLFPFFVLSKMFVGYGGSELAGKLFKSVMKPLFGISSQGATPFIMGITCGYPVGAKTAADMQKQALISKKEAENLICFSNNSGPLFIIGAVGVGFLSSSKMGIFLYITHILSAITIGILLKYSLPKETNTHKKRQCSKKAKNIFINSVEESVSSVLNVFAYVIFFAIILGIISDTGMIDTFTKLLSVFGIDKSISASVICSLIEMTSGIKMLNTSNAVFSTKLIIISFMLGWSGVSIHLQTKSICGSIGLSFSKYVLIKFFHGITASVYTYIGLIFINTDKSVFVSQSYKLPLNANIPQALIYATIIICLAYFIMTVRSKSNTRYSKQRQI